MSTTPRGTVRLTAPPAMEAVILPIVGRFLQQYPNIQVTLSFTTRVVDLCEEDFDIAIRAGDCSHSSLIAERVGVALGGLFASRGYVERRGRPRNLADLAKHDFVIYPNWFKDSKVLSSLAIKEKLQLDSHAGYVHAIRSGIGLGLFPFYLIRHWRSLVRILPNDVSYEVPVNVITANKQLAPARALLFRDFLVNGLTSVRWRP
jgi:DNA-binding transcriptional LysR family regulator